MNIQLPDIGALEDYVTMELLLGDQPYTLSMLYNPRTGRWYYSIEGVQENVAVGAPLEIPGQGVLTWSQCPTSRDLSGTQLFLIS